ncbi:hypothetical protein [Arthrobacter sp. AD-310]
MDPFVELPGDRAAARFAYGAAGLGVLGVATLGAMYAVEVPRNGPFVFGTINDAVGGVFNLAVIPVMVQLHRRLPSSPGWEAGKVVVVSACAAGSASSFLLVARKLDFAPSTAVSLAAMAVQGAWLLAANRALLETGGYPPQLGKLGVAIGGALVGALPVAGLAFAKQLPRWLRWGVGGPGVAVGAAAWVAWPYWYYLAGRHLSHSPRAVR